MGPTLSPVFAFPEDKLQSVEKQYLKDLQKENQKWSSRTEKHLLELHKQWEHKKKKLLNEEVGNKCQNQLLFLLCYALTSNS